MPPPGYEPFLRSICENPEDDTVRLVYADWLEENGDLERAEFIRLQIACAAQPGGDNYARDFARAEELRLMRAGRTWDSEVPVAAGLEWFHCYLRGFFYCIHVTSGKWSVHDLEAAFAAAPITHLTLTEAGQAGISALLAVPAVCRLRNLGLWKCRMLNSDWRVLTHCPRLTGLRQLAIEPGYTAGRNLLLTEAEARFFVEAPSLEQLERLDLHGSISHAAAELLLGRFKTVLYQGAGR